MKTIKIVSALTNFPRLSGWFLRCLVSELVCSFFHKYKCWTSLEDFIFVWPLKLQPCITVWMEKLVQNVSDYVQEYEGKDYYIRMFAIKSGILLFQNRALAVQWIG